jgi:hypothetical protein
MIWLIKEQVLIHIAPSRTFGKHFPKKRKSPMRSQWSKISFPSSKIGKSGCEEGSVTQVSILYRNSLKDQKVHIGTFLNSKLVLNRLLRKTVKMLKTNPILKVEAILHRCHTNGDQ